MEDKLKTYYTKLPMNMWGLLRRLDYGVIYGIDVSIQTIGGVIWIANLHKMRKNTVVKITTDLSYRHGRVICISPCKRKTGLIKPSTALRKIDEHVHPCKETLTKAKELIKTYEEKQCQ